MENPKTNKNLTNGGIVVLVIGIVLFFFIISIIGIILVIVGLIMLAVGLSTSPNQNQSPAQMIPTKYLILCPSCNNRIDSDVSFCPRCGLDLRPKTVS
jgi:hypothetical protein